MEDELVLKDPQRPSGPVKLKNGWTRSKPLFSTTRFNLPNLYNAMNMLIRWLVYSLAIFIAAYLLPGVDVAGLAATLVTALVLGLINTVLRPVFLILTLPINLLSLGLFTLVINALLIMLADAIVPGFAVASFWWALLFGVVLAVIRFALNGIVREASQEPYHQLPPRVS